MSSLKPIKLYSHAGGPNPWKCAIIMAELDVPYETEYLQFGPQIKEPPYTDMNPNGRLPTITDPNTGITIWESGAIVEYLIDTYDKSYKLSYATTSAPEYWACKQWLAFQISGQGPYYGNGVYFTVYHSEFLPSARKRFLDEIVRTISVIDLHLSKSSSQTLVGDKITYADLSFFPWAAMVEWIFGMKDQDDEKKMLADAKEEYPRYFKWFDGMMARPDVKKIWDERAEMTKKKD